MFRRLLAKLSPSNPLIEVGINKSALLHNIRTYQKAYPDMLVAPVLKSNAYGHDIGLVARVLDTEGIAFFMVDSLYEARRLRISGVRSRVVVMGYTRPEDIIYCKLSGVDFAITDTEQLRVLARIATSRVTLHIKFDTGMHRQGIPAGELAMAISLVHSNTHLEIVGACSHFADADSEGSAHTRRQLTVWNTMLAHLRASVPIIAYRHISATKGTRFAEEADTNVLRLGIGLYGFDTSPTPDNALTPVLSMRSVIGGLRTISAQESVGYNATYTATHTTVVATVPAGYYEGMDRRLSNKGFVRIRNIWCPIIGRISMNMLAVDVTAVPDVVVGDSVLLISAMLADPNSVPQIASLISTPEYRETAYVILTHIPQHLKRVLE